MLLGEGIASSHPSTPPLPGLLMGTLEYYLNKWLVKLEVLLLA